MAQKEYLRLRHQLCYWRTTGHHEVDFILQNGTNVVAIEVKGTEFPDKADFKGLRIFAEEFTSARKILVCNCAASFRTEDGIEVLGIEEFLSQLWNGNVHPVEEE